MNYASSSKDRVCTLQTRNSEILMELQLNTEGSSQTDSLTTEIAIKKFEIITLE